MMILNQYKKRMKDGKDHHGNQRWTEKEYAEIICENCGETTTIWLDNFKKNKTPKGLCRSCRRLSKGSLENGFYYVNRVKELYAKRYIVENKQHASSKDSLVLICKKHNEKHSARIPDLLYSPIRYNTLDVIGPCKECQRLLKRKFTTSKRLKHFRLYYLYFPDIKMYKLGISSQENLLKRTYNKPFKLIWTHQVSYTHGRTLENRLHKFFAEKAYQGKEKVLKDGNTELYPENILPSHHSLIQLIFSDLWKKFHI